MTLREKLIKAGAPLLEDYRWELCHDPSDAVRAEATTAVFDAFLDCLTENQLEWFDAAGWTDDADDLIRVLREPAHNNQENA